MATGVGGSAAESVHVVRGVVWGGLPLEGSSRMGPRKSFLESRNLLRKSRESTNPLSMAPASSTPAASSANGSMVAPPTGLGASFSRTLSSVPSFLPLCSPPASAQGVISCTPSVHQTLPPSSLRLESEPCRGTGPRAFGAGGGVSGFAGLGEHSEAAPAALGVGAGVGDGAGSQHSPKRPPGPSQSKSQDKTSSTSSCPWLWEREPGSIRDASCSSSGSCPDELVSTRAAPGCLSPLLPAAPSPSSDL